MKSFLRAFGSYLPAGIASNDLVAARTGVDPGWIQSISGIQERRFASEDESVADLGFRAASDCIERAGMPAAHVGMIIMASGTGNRRFPGPAVNIAHRLGLNETPAIDLPMASAGSLFGIALAGHLAATYKNVLIIGAEVMSRAALVEGADPGTAALFGDGAGACLVSTETGDAFIADSTLHSDGAFSDHLFLEFQRPIEMIGRSVILHASRKLPRAISTLLSRNGIANTDVDAFLLHQANQNLLHKVADGLGVPKDRFYSSVQRYGNTSSASLLLATAEWWMSGGFHPGIPVVLGAFGAGFNWGALLAIGADGN